MDASHTDANTAYAAINTLRLDDLRPYIYRTRDGAKRWTHITNGIPDGRTVNVVREDHEREGLLFADTGNSVRDPQAAVIAATLRTLNGRIGPLYRIVEGADVGPTSQLVAGAGEVERHLRETLARWEALNSR